MTKIKRPKIERAIDELWLPPSSQRKPSQPPSCKRFMGHYPCDDCCSGTGGDCDICTCEDCSGTSNFATCCWKVVITGFVENTCTACHKLDRTYRLPPIDDESEITLEGCSWSTSDVCGPPGVTNIWLTVFKESNDYIIEVTLGNHIWRKNYGTSEPGCCTLSNESLMQEATTGDCDNTDVTCIITALSDSDACDRNPCTAVPCNCTCDKFCAEAAPCCIVATISGLTNGSCGDCGDLNTSFTLDQTADGACTWSDTIDPSICGISSIAAELYLDAGDYKLKITLGDHVWEHNFGTTKPDCATFASETYSRTGSNAVCDGSSATISLSAGCPPADCSACSVYPFEWAVDLGVGGWVDDTCDYCDQVMGVFVLESTYIDPEIGIGDQDPEVTRVCLSGFPIDAVCQTFAGPPPITASLLIELSIVLLGGGNKAYQLRVLLWKNSFAYNVITYRSASEVWTDCFFLADIDGKIALTRFNEHSLLDVCQPVGGDPMPTTVYIWDANA